MRSVKTQEVERIEKPKMLTPNNVCYWIEREGILLGDQKSKALKFLQNDCIKKIGDNEWVVLPIKNYNVTTHSIKDEKCSCQYNRRYEKECSHLTAIKMSQFIEKWK